MPRLSLTMKEGTVVQWFKKEGEMVQKGEPLVEVLSVASEGSDVPVDQVIGIVAAADEHIIEERIPAPPAPTQEIEEVTRAVLKPDAVRERIPASPAAKRLAKELRVDLTQVRGTGPEGRIVEDDVRRSAEQRGLRLRVKEVVPLTGIRKTTAERLTLSAKTAPHSAIVMELDMTNASEFQRETQFSYTEMLIKAVAKALLDHRLLNATLEGEQIKVFEDINVGVAVTTENGLVVPVIRNADKKSLSEISSVLKELVEKARQGKLTREDLTAGTFTITNLGMYGVDVFFPIINPPETAILGVGRVVDKPVAVDGQVTIKPLMQLSLVYDHRIVDGAPAARFLQTVKQVLETNSFKDN